MPLYPASVPGVLRTPVSTNHPLIAAADVPIRGLKDLTGVPTNVRYVPIVAHCGRDHQPRAQDRRAGHAITSLGRATP
ncbi:hypothetical protein GCM10023196_070180 [Actinoallomurus vinaceus]|uniref:Uncharacterized protein n=1 Tax=Actinoallomurus vinaceus TaxID=1080074 RepID=A0ABP8UJK4_9ACTN